MGFNLGEERYCQVKAMVADRLAERGWSVVDRLSMRATAAVATKQFDSAVGVKQAIAYITPFEKEGVGLLSGDYQSEGRNILGAASFSVRYDSSPQEIEAVVEDFAKAVEKAVSESFAVRLLANQ